MGSLKKEVSGLLEAIAVYEDLTAEAAVEGSHKKALHALLAHPFVQSVDKAKRMLNEFLTAHKQYLPQFSK